MPGYEAGGHRGMFDPQLPDDRLGTLALTRLLVKRARLPIISAGGIMDGAGIAACLHLGACAVQLGTAFIACPESSAEALHRSALTSQTGEDTVRLPCYSVLCMLRASRCCVFVFPRGGLSAGMREKHGGVDEYIRTSTCDVPD